MELGAARGRGARGGHRRDAGFRALPRVRLPAPPPGAGEHACPGVERQEEDRRHTGAGRGACASWSRAAHHLLRVAIVAEQFAAAVDP